MHKCFLQRKPSPTKRDELWRFFANPKKMRLNKFIFPFAIFLTIEVADAQVKSESAFYDPVKVGDKMPDYTLVNLINYSKKTAKISDFNNKLVIFDLWGT